MTKRTELERMADFVTSMKNLAEELYQTRMDLNTRELRFKQETDASYEKEALLKSELLSKLKAVGLKSLKVESGDSFFISPRTGVEVNNEGALITWAFKNNLVKPDADKVKKHLMELVKTETPLPEFVSLIESESIGIRKYKKE